MSTLNQICLSGHRTRRCLRQPESSASGYTTRTHVGKRTYNVSLDKEQTPSMFKHRHHMHENIPLLGNTGTMREDPRLTCFTENNTMDNQLRQDHRLRGFTQINSMDNQPNTHLRENLGIENEFLYGVFQQEDVEGCETDPEIMAKETRGPTYMQNIWGRAPNLPPIHVEYNEFGQPIGGENSKLCHFLGSISRNEHSIEERDERVLLDQWVKLLTYWRSEEAKKASHRNKNARENKIMNQRTGKTSFAQIRARLTKEQGRCPTRVELFKSCFVPSDGTSSVALSKYPEMQERSNQLPEGYNDGIGPNDVFSQIMGDDAPGHDGMNVLLKSLFNPTKIVAKGYVRNTDPSTVVGGQMLGLNWCEVNVQVIVDPEERLIRPYNNLQMLSETKGAMIAWPCNLVAPIKE
ncbi:hypothetical protein C2S52_022821 [Perilla frutescens var. hirtella]|nr:hypothetical protein C2S52_022821 [Perilla frutescens var. hirtella]